MAGGFLYIVVDFRYYPFEVWYNIGWGFQGFILYSIFLLSSDRQIDSNSDYTSSSSLPRFQLTIMANPKHLQYYFLHFAVSKGQDLKSYLKKEKLSIPLPPALLSCQVTVTNSFKTTRLPSPLGYGWLTDRPPFRPTHHPTYLERHNVNSQLNKRKQTVITTANILNLFIWVTRLQRAKDTLVDK